MKMFTKFLRNEEGTTGIEFGLVAVGLLTMIFGAFEAGRVFLTWNSFQWAVENATRYALVTDDVTEAELIERIADDMRSVTVNPDNVDLDISFYKLSEIDFIEIEGRYIFETVVPFLPANWANINIVVGSRLPVPEETVGS